MRGIAPGGTSIALSGGYIDDIDEGETIIYTGEGGRDAISGQQIADQELTRGNLALAKNKIDGRPVRVNRGAHLKSRYAPESGYRYDGLYRVQHYWQERGKRGFIICRFRLERLEGQPPLGVVAVATEVPANGITTPIGNTQPHRIQITTSRVIRSTSVGNEVKSIYNHTCQACGVRLETPAGPYSECCHIRPLGIPHNGPDTINNVLCLCPNCHVLFDDHAIIVEADYSMRGTGRFLSVLPQHEIAAQHLEYHRSMAGKP